MSTSIFNEGRVVGYSAYEQYVKQALAQDPNTDPASEREWLASTIANGSSMLLRVTASNDLIRDFFLPVNTRLCAANMIVASFFVGEGHFATNNDIWADRITSYGNLLANSNDNHPSGNVSATDNIPIVNPIPDNYEANLKKQLMQYIKISDGIVIQPGTWEDAGASDNSPKMKLSPDLTSSGYPRIRLSLKSPITTTFYILFTGFTNKVVIQGTSGIGTSANTPSPQDGDFLGPATYPWSNKVIFSTPAVLTYYLKTGLHAQSGTDEGTGPWNNITIHQNDDATEVGIEVQKQISSNYENVVISPQNNRHQSDVDIEVQKQISVDVDNTQSNIIKVSPENNIHDKDTKITVKNVIHTTQDESFLIIRQTQGGGDTDINIDEEKLVAEGLDNILHGKTGIQVAVGSSASNFIKLATNLKSGTGILIDPASSLDSSDNTPQIISTNLKGGVGIGLKSNSDGSVTITNTIATGDYTKLELGKDYVITWYGNFFAGYDDGSAHTSGLPSDKGTIDVAVQITKDNAGNITAAAIKFSTNEEAHRAIKYAGNIANTSDFNFRHSNMYTDMPQSKLFTVKFIGEYANLNNYGIINTSGSSTGIWNLYDSSGGRCGASWHANCSLQRDHNGKDSNGSYIYTGKGFTVSAVQYADGYNGDLLHYGKNLYVISHINLELTGSLKI